MTRQPLAEIAERVGAALPIRLGVEALRVDRGADGRFRVACRAQAGGQGELDADAVVMATGAGDAAAVASPLLTPPERDYLHSVRSLPEIVLSLALSAPPSGMPQRVRIPRVESQPIQSLLLEPGIEGGRAPREGGIAVLRASDRFCAANQTTLDEVVEKGLRAGLGRIFPNVASTVVESVLHRRSAATPYFEVGTYRALARFRSVQEDRRSLGRRLYFAGDHLIGPGAEASVVSGLRAAADFASDT